MQGLTPEAPAADEPEAAEQPEDLPWGRLSRPTGAPAVNRPACGGFGPMWASAPTERLRQTRQPAICFVGTRIARPRAKRPLAEGKIVAQGHFTRRTKGPLVQRGLSWREP